MIHKFIRSMAVGLTLLTGLLTTEVHALLFNDGPFVTYGYAEGRAGGYREGGGGGLFVPVWQCCDRLVFAEALGGYWKHEGVGSVGLGYRQLMNKSVAFGANAWFDYAWTDRGHNDYYQGGFGGEIIGGCWGVRGNAYLASPHRKNLREIATANTFFFERESAFRGCDIEAGYGICTCWGQFWVWAGYFGFHAGGDRAMQGPRLRGEYRVRDIFDWCGAELYLGGEYEYDAIRKSEGSFIAGIRIPIGCCTPQCCKACTPCARMNEPVWRERGIWTRRTKHFVADNPNAL